MGITAPQRVMHLQSCRTKARRQCALPCDMLNQSKPHTHLEVVPRAFMGNYFTRAWGPVAMSAEFAEMHLARKFCHKNHQAHPRLGPQVPQGTTPRSIVVHLKGGLTRSCKPGDAVSIAGVFLPEPYTGAPLGHSGALSHNTFSCTRYRKNRCYLWAFDP